MATEPRVLARNTTYFTLALIAQKVISFLYFTFLARLLVPEEIGKYIFALSFTTIFSVLIDGGLGYVLTTEVAKARDKAQSYWQTIIGFKLVAMLAVIALVAGTINIMGYPEFTKQLVYIASVVMVIDSLVLSAYSLLRAYQTLIWESIGTILFQVVVAIVGISLAQVTQDIRVLVVALIVGGLVNLIYSWRQLKVRYRIRLLPKFSWQALKPLLILAWPFGLALILTRIYGYLDTVLLSLLAGDRAVGFYGVAYKITFAFQFIPAAFAASLLAGFSYYFASAPQLLTRTFERSVHYLSLLAVPLGVGVALLAPELIRIIYPGYEQAVLPLQILMISLIFLFLTFPIGSLLSAGGRQRRNTVNLAITVIVSIILNLFLIPRYGPTGAAIASLVSTVIYLGLGWVVAAKMITINTRVILLNAFKVLISTLVMALILYLIPAKFNVFIQVVVAMLVYGVMLLLIKGISLRELRDLVNLLFNRQTITAQN